MWFNANIKDGKRGLETCTRSIGRKNIHKFLRVELVACWLLTSDEYNRFRKSEIFSGRGRCHMTTYTGVSEEV